MRKKKTSYNWYKILLCGLVFFVIGGTVFCMIAESKESAEKRARAEAEQKAEEAAERAEEEARIARKESLLLKPGVPAGTLEPKRDEKMVYLTFDDGPSENTQKLLDMLKE